MKTDVKAATMTVSGTVYGARTRVRGVVLMADVGSSTGSVTLSDGAAVVMTFAVANGLSYSVLIPEDGVLFSTSVEITLTNATAVVFYG